MTQSWWLVAFVAGVAPIGLQAQDLAGSVAPPAAPPVEFRGPDGKPLPPEIQRQLAEQLRANPAAFEGVQDGDDAPGDIVVSGGKPRGSVIGDLPPERTFNQLDIRAFGADNIAALLDVLAPQVASNRGRGDGAPVTLLNGRRIADFAEIARIPTEAIERLEVFPEELALQYGYRADQKVVNVVTRARFQSRIGQAGLLLPTDGGRETGIANIDLLTIRDDTRFGLGAGYTRSAALLESERSLRQPAARPELGETRSLLPSAEQLVLNGVLSAPLLPDVSATVSGTMEASRAESLLGPGDSAPLRSDTARQLARVAATLSGRNGAWQWTFTGALSHVGSEARTDVRSRAGRRDLARSVDTLADANLLLSGPLLELPAGPLAASLSGGFAQRTFDSRSLRGGIDERTWLSRDRSVLQASIDLPLLPSVAANANAGVEHLSDVGTLRTFGYGLVWSPAKAISLIGSVTHEGGAPTMEQLGGPTLATPGIRTFDFARNEVVDITRITGSNRSLRPDDRHVVRIGLAVRPVSEADFTISLDYVATRTDDPIASFPILSPAIEAAFPDRFARSGDGRLASIDGRPLNFVRARQQQLRTGFDFTRPLGPLPPGTQGGDVRIFASEAEARRAFPGGVFIRAEPGSPMARGAGNLASRLFASLYHNWSLQDQVVLRADLPALDLLRGGATDLSGGRPRHEIEFQAGIFRRGLGARISATWRSGTIVQGSGTAAGELRFAGLATVDLNLFANLAERLGGSTAQPWLRGTRVSLGITNLFNTRRQVRNSTGAVPLSYQPAYLDPIGRLVSLSLRKVF